MLQEALNVYGRRDTVIRTKIVVQLTVLQGFVEYGLDVKHITPIEGMCIRRAQVKRGSAGPEEKFEN
jgi:hypothetical protein